MHGLGALLNRVFNASPAAVLLLDQRLIIRSANEHIGALLGRPAEALRGRSLMEFVAGDAESLLRFLTRCSGSGSAMPGVLTLATPGGPSALVTHGAGLRIGDETFVLLHCTEGRRGSAVFRRLEEQLQVLHRELHQERRLHLKLKRALEEREALLHEVHHRVRNNLQIITSLLNLQMREDDGGDARETLRKAQARIGALALVHNQLYSQGDVSMIDMAVLLPKLCHALAGIFGVTDRVGFAASMPRWPLPVDRASPLALLVTEIITNALKHAYPEERAGTISLTLCLVDGEPRLRIADDGVGLSAEAQAAQHRSVGWQLMRGLTEQLGARLELRPGDGLEVVVNMPPKDAELFDA